MALVVYRGSGGRMFGLGWMEIVFVLILAYFAFRHLILRRFPGIYRALNFIFYATAFMILAFAVITRFK